MNCREAQDLIPIQAAGAAVPEESAHLEEHLDSCPHCRKLMADFAEVAAHLAIVAAPTPVPGVLREALARRIDQSVPPTTLKMPPRNAGLSLTLAIAAGLALFIAAGVSFYIQYLDKIQIHGLHELLAFSEGQNRKVMAHEAEVVAIWKNRVQGLRIRVTQADQIIHMLKVPHLQMASLQGAGQQPSAFGRLFWDQHAKIWKFCAADLKQLSADKTYELWWITAARKKIPAGTFNVDESGFAMFTPTLPEGMKLSPTLTAAVTIEPAGGDLQPQGPVELIGKL